MRALSAESRISRPSQHNNRKPTRHMPAEEASILIDSLTRRVEADRGEARQWPAPGAGKKVSALHELSPGRGRPLPTGGARRVSEIIR